MTTDAVAAQIIRQYEQERTATDQAVPNAMLRIVGACAQARNEGAVDAFREVARQFPLRRWLVTWATARADQLEAGR